MATMISMVRGDLLRAGLRPHIECPSPGVVASLRQFKEAREAQAEFERRQASARDRAERNRRALQSWRGQ